MPVAEAPKAAERRRHSSSHLRTLEAESISILREVAAVFERPALLFSGGKDSTIIVHLARKAFAPARLPFPLMHVDTGHNFEEVLAFRDDLVSDIGGRLVVASVQEAIDKGLAVEDPGPNPSRNRAQSPTLLHAVETHRFDALIGGARRDEEKARAKERVFSLRDDFGSWDPRRQRPELWDLYNADLRVGEHMRVFPLSNWTENDVWDYIAAEQIALPALYFAHEREVVIRRDQLLPTSRFLAAKEGEETQVRRVRFRTVGDATCTAAWDSAAVTVQDVIAENLASRVSERGGRVDDAVSEAAMEDRKKEGYF